ncbi:MAG: hypothetical protein ABIR94_10245 [Rubrivivax sp.]
MVWMTVLKLVPWGEVVKAAPQVAEGARKLWETVGRGTAAPAETPPAAARDVSVGASPDQRLARRLAASEASVAQLQQQMQAASKLINALADQNAELVARVETHRARLLWVAGSVALAAVMALVALVAVFLGAGR